MRPKGAKKTSYKKRFFRAKSCSISPFFLHGKRKHCGVYSTNTLFAYIEYAISYIFRPTALATAFCAQRKNFYTQRNKIFFFCTFLFKNANFAPFFAAFGAPVGAFFLKIKTFGQKRLNFCKKLADFGIILLDNGGFWVRMEENGKLREKMSSEIKERAYYYAGEYKRSLDDKRRLIVPAKWRFSGDDKDNAYLALPNPNGSITVYPPNMLEKLDEKISQAGLTNPSRQRVLLKIFRNGERFGCDKQGRISLTDKLMSMAGIAKDAILVGA